VEARGRRLLVLTGPSGSGKSTLLRLLAGLEPLDRGSILINGADVGRTAPDKRGVSMIFQGFALFPHLTVRENIAFPLTMRGASAKSTATRVNQVAKLCGVTDHLPSRPEGLSFDIRQRTTMARAVVRRPDVVCLDEPLAGSGVPLTLRGRTPIGSLQRELEVTMLYATCSSEDAWAIADRVAVLDRGTLHQVGTPRDVFLEPASIAVAQFLGSPAMNLVTAAVEGRTARIGRLAVPVSAAQLSSLSGNRIVVGLRPEDLAIGGEGEGIRAVTVLVRDTGREYLITTRTNLGGDEVDLVVRHTGAPPPVKGENVVVGVAGAARFHLFDEKTGRRLAG